jgi:hypothetical protein
MLAVQLSYIETFDAFRPATEIQNPDQFVQRWTRAPFFEALPQIFQGVLPGHGKRRLVAFLITRK